MKRRSLYLLGALLPLLGCGGRPGQSSEETSTSGGPQLDCAVYLDEEACLAAGCAGMFEVIEVTDASTCESQVWDRVCLDQGSPSGVARSYYTQLDGSMTFYSTAPCDENVESTGIMAPGAPWVECTGAPDEPAGCACMCSEGHCPGELELEEQLACQSEMLCPEFDLNGWTPPQSEATAQCFFDALKAGQPGYLRAYGNFGDPVYLNHLWVMPNGQVRFAQLSSDVSCIDCCEELTPQLSLCTVAGDEVLDACLQAYLDPDTVDHPCTDDFTQWFESCTPTNPSCP